MCLPYQKFSDLLPETHFFFYLALYQIIMWMKNGVKKWVYLEFLKNLCTQHA